jgi:hypothetical protein
LGLRQKKASSGGYAEGHTTVTRARPGDGRPVLQSRPGSFKGIAGVSGGEELPPGTDPSESSPPPSARLPLVAVALQPALAAFPLFPWCWASPAKKLPKTIMD